MQTSKLSLALLFALAASATMVSCNEAPKPAAAPVSESASVEALGQANRDFAKSLTAHNAAAAADIYDENASILPPNEKIVTGKANILKYWQGAIDAGLIDGSVETIDAKSDGKLGYEIGRFVIRMKGPKGDTITEKGKYTEILRLDSASGKWISIYGMWNADEAAH